MRAVASQLPQTSNQRPSQGQLNNFLNMPADTGPGKSDPRYLLAQRSCLPRAERPNVTGPAGGQITAGGVGGSRTGPGGTTVGAGRARHKGHGARWQ